MHTGTDVVAEYKVAATNKCIRGCVLPSPCRGTAVAIGVTALSVVAMNEQLPA